MKNQAQWDQLAVRYLKASTKEEQEGIKREIENSSSIQSLFGRAFLLVGAALFGYLLWVIWETERNHFAIDVKAKVYMLAMAMVLCAGASMAAYYSRPSVYEVVTDFLGRNPETPLLTEFHDHTGYVTPEQINSHLNVRLGCADIP